MNIDAHHGSSSALRISAMPDLVQKTRLGVGPDIGENMAGLSLLRDHYDEHPIASISVSSRPTLTAWKLPFKDVMNTRAQAFKASSIRCFADRDL